MTPSWLTLPLQALADLPPLDACSASLINVLVGIGVLLLTRAMWRSQQPVRRRRAWLVGALGLVSLGYGLMGLRSCVLSAALLSFLENAHE